MDTHLCEPHFYTSKFMCNFCSDFKTERKEDYRVHLKLVHDRDAKFEIKFLSNDLMCQICDFECFSMSSRGYLDKHRQASCPFREDNLLRSEYFLSKGLADAQCFIDYKHILNNILSPNDYDTIDYEFMFGTRPLGMFVNKYGLLTQTINPSSPMTYAIRKEESNKYVMFKTLQALINEDRGRKPDKPVVKIGSQKPSLDVARTSSSSAEQPPQVITRTVLTCRVNVIIFNIIVYRKTL
jgi:hypothetical protein